MQAHVPNVDVNASFRQIIQELTSGCQGTVAVKDNGKLSGIITDGDLRRYMEKCEDFVNATAESMMTRNPITMPQDAMIIDAEEKMTKHRISSLLITDSNQEVFGLVRIFD